MSTQVVLDDHDFFGVGIMQFGKHLHEHGVFPTGTVLKDRTDPLSLKRLKGSKQITDAVAFIFVVFAPDLTQLIKRWVICRFTLLSSCVSIHSCGGSRVIKSFKDKEAEKIFDGQFSSRLPENIQRIALRKLTQIHGAATLNFLRVPPANRLEKLSGDREGLWSIRINDQWRICFEWRDGDAERVEITDYH